MIQWIRWFRSHLVTGHMRNRTERRCGYERRKCHERRCEPRYGESMRPRRIQQRRETQPAGR